jgi:quinol monooxygenase YgiN
VSAWRDLAEWTVKHTPGAGAATLVQDTGQPNRFVSFGPWASAEAIDAWRASSGFQGRVGKIRALPEAFEPGTFRRRASVGIG